MAKGDFWPYPAGAVPGATGHATVVPDATPSAGPWTPIANLPEAVAESAVGHHNGTVYSVGGCDGSTRMSTGYVYGPITWA